MGTPQRSSNMPQEYEFTGHEKATTIAATMTEILVIYHNTVVVKIDRVKQEVTFDTGGWETATTRRRINQACGTYKLPYRAHIENRELWVTNDDGDAWGLFPVTLPL